MWGRAFGILGGGVIVLLFVIALAFGFSPLLAIFVMFVALLGLGAALVLRRIAASSGAPGHAEAKVNPLTNPRNPDSGGAPVSGEGSAPRR